MDESMVFPHLKRNGRDKWNIYSLAKRIFLVMGNEGERNCSSYELVGEMEIGGKNGANLYDTRFYPVNS